MKYPLAEFNVTLDIYNRNIAALSFEIYKKYFG